MIQIKEKDADFIAKLLREFVDEYKEGEQVARRSCEMLINILPEEMREEAIKDNEVKFQEADKKWQEKINKLNKAIELMMIGSE